MPPSIQVLGGRVPPLGSEAGEPWTWYPWALIPGLPLDYSYPVLPPDRLTAGVSTEARELETLSRRWSTIKLCVYLPSPNSSLRDDRLKLGAWLL